MNNQSNIPTSKLDLSLVLKIVAVVVWGLGFYSGPARAQGSPALDSASQEALQKTQQGLTNPAERAKMIKGDAKAMAHDEKVKSTLGDQSEGAYQLSSEILQKLVEDSGGDAKKMQELVGEMMRNPNLIEKYLSAGQREKIRGMASEIEKKNGSPSAAGQGR